MLNALAAEAMKLQRHKATWFLVWIFPIGCIIVSLIAIAVGMARNLPPDHPTLAQWINGSTIIWDLASSANGRYLLAAFTAVVFAGEYGWNTWKLIIPHRARTTLIASKYAMIFLSLLTAYTLTAGLTIFGRWAEDLLTGDIIPSGITAGALLQVHAKSALAALAPALVTLACTSLAAVLTRSTMAAVVIGIVATTVEQIIFGGGPGLSLALPSFVPAIWSLYHVLPGYHLANLAEWIDKGVALTVKFPNHGIVALPWATSLAVVTAWIVPFIAATFAIFRRQDIN